MRDAFVDVTYEVPALELAMQRDPPSYVLERMRDRADALCAEQGARLRTDRSPEVIVNQAVERATGADTVLIASRWAVVVPDAVAPG